MPSNEDNTIGRPLRIAQITDTHLYLDPDGQLLGLNTRDSLEKVIDLALQSGQPDLVVASGDLAHDGLPDTYQLVRSCFSRIGAPIYCLPGNHDEAVVFGQCMNSHGFHTIGSDCIGGWQLVFMDSSVTGGEGGHLKRTELNALDAALGSHPELPTLVWLHHQPVHIGSRWLDTMAVDNPDAFFTIIDRHSQVRAVVWGHVHQTFDQHRKGVRLLAAPSTCVQFLPQSDSFAVDLIPPGYRWLDLYPDGRLETGVERLSQIPGELDLDAGGY